MKGRDDDDNNRNMNSNNNRTIASVNGLPQAPPSSSCPPLASNPPPPPPNSSSPLLDADGGQFNPDSGGSLTDESLNPASSVRRSSLPDESLNRASSVRRSSLPDDFRSLPLDGVTTPALDVNSLPPKCKSARPSSLGGGSFRLVAPFGGESDPPSDGASIFHIPPKDAPPESLRRWRNATLVLNATRRFRYTADLHHNRELLVLRFRTTACALRAVHRFKLAGSSGEVDEPPPPGFGVPPEKLVRILRDKDLPTLKELGNVHGVAGLLRVNPDVGIEGSPEDLQRRSQAYGANTYPKKAQKNFLIYVWEALQDTTLIILIVCAALALGFGIRNHGIKEGWYDGISIAVAVLLVVLVTAISDFKQSLKFKSLNEEKQNIHVSVKRGGRVLEISIYGLVVGDIVPLKVGDRVPADGLLINGHSLSLDESSMTGESDHVIVDGNRPFLLSGSKVANGVGTMLVSAVGERTEWGNLMAALSEDMGGETPLQVRLNGVATFIGQAGLTVAGLVLVILIVFYFTGHTDNSEGERFVAGVTNANTIVNHIVDILTIAVTIVVVAVPEGLPLAVTLSLAYSMRKMMADKALVRRLSACETMGSATVICSDKTGTLTLNQMTVVKAWVASEIIESTGELEGKMALSALSLLFDGIAWNTNGDVFIPPGGGAPEISGSPTEKAILEWGLKAGMNFNRVKSKLSILKMEPFNSVKKQSAVVLKSADSGVYAHWKGAAELVLESSDRCLEMGGSTIPISPETRMELLKVIEGMAASSLRCIAFALKEISAGEVPQEEGIEGWHVPDTGLTLAAIFGIKDPCRPEVYKAVVDCQQAGVKVCMVTGDNLATAKAIALECGILQTGDAIEGKTFREWSEDQQHQRVRTISVMARSLPSDKLLLVKAFKAVGDVVAVTGDGTNDAPALDEADIGLAMGEQGTEVAKDSSDIIILDDNFSSVVKVVRWGRSIYTNIQKFIQFQLTVNVAALSINFVAAVSSGSVPLTAVQLLWVNLIMDTLGALALATEPPTDDLMLRLPVGRKEPLVTNQMWFHILSQAFYQIAVLLTLQFRGNDILGNPGDAVIDTIIFNAFVFCQIFNEVNARKPSELNIFKGILKNRMFLAIVFSTAVLQVLIVEFLEKFASTVRLDWNHWLICIGIGFVSWPVAFLVKFIPVPKKPFLNTNSSRWRWRRGSRPQAPITQEIAT